MMADIGNAERVELMQRLVALEVEHRDLDAAIHRLGEHSGHDQLQLTRLKRRKLLLRIRSRGSSGRSTRCHGLIDAGCSCATRGPRGTSLRHLSRTRPYVVEADDVILTEIVTALHLDHHQRIAYRVLEAMLGLHGMYVEPLALTRKVSSPRVTLATPVTTTQCSLRRWWSCSESAPRFHSIRLI